MASTARVIDKDEGWAELKKRLSDLSQPNRVAVGVQSNATGKSEDGSLNMAALASVHEFGARIEHPGGTPYKVTERGAVFVKKGTHGIDGVTKAHMITIPERSFIRSTVDENAGKYNRLAKALMRKIVGGQLELRQALGLIGAKVQADIKRRIQRGIDPPLRPRTIERKRSSKQLIDTGQLLNSITYEVGRDLEGA